MPGDEFDRGRRHAEGGGECANASAIRRAFDRALPHAQRQNAVFVGESRPLRSGFDVNVDQARCRYGSRAFLTSSITSRPINVIDPVV